MSGDSHDLARGAWQWPKSLVSLISLQQGEEEEATEESEVGMDNDEERGDGSAAVDAMVDQKDRPQLQVKEELPQLVHPL